MAEEILKVRLRTDKIKYLIVPKSAEIYPGEYVVISNNLNMIEEIKAREVKNAEKGTGWRGKTRRRNRRN